MDEIEFTYGKLINFLRIIFHLYQIFCLNLAEASLHNLISEYQQIGNYEIVDKTNDSD